MNYECNGSDAIDHIAILYGSQPCPLCYCYTEIDLLGWALDCGVDVYEMGEGDSYERGVGWFAYANGADGYLIGVERHGSQVDALIALRLKMDEDEDA